jgi:hypothetical protein
MFPGTCGGGVCLEASRLARSNADWHRLLELGRYDPAGFNDGYCWDSRARWRKRSCTSSARASWAGNSTKRKKENCDFHSVELCHDEDGHVHPIALSPLAATLTKNTRVGVSVILWLTRNPIRITVVSNHREPRSTCVPTMSRHESPVTSTLVAAFPSECYDLVFHDPC